MCYPFVFKISSKNILFIGGGRVAFRKIKSLLDYSPNIHVVSNEFHDGILRLADNKELTVIKKKAQINDIDSCFDFVFVCTDDYNTNRAVVRVCKQKNIPVNVADNPAECDFFMPALIDKGDFLIAVSSKGKNPSKSKKIKEILLSLMKNVSL